MRTPTAVPNDLQLVQQARDGDSDSFGDLVRRYQERVYMLALQMTHNHADADEISQQAFLRAYESLPQFRAQSNFFTWIYRITVNLCLTHLKNRNRFVPLTGSNTEEESSTGELGVIEQQGAGVEEDQKRRQVWKALATLSSELRAAVALVYLQDFSPKEAAQSLGCAEATVHWRLFKARKLLKKVLS